MNPESKKTFETPRETAEEEVERLKAGYPEMQNDKYWQCLEEAIVAHRRLTEILAPLTNLPVDFSDQGLLSTTDELSDAKKQLAAMLNSSQGQTARAIAEKVLDPNTPCYWFIPKKPIGIDMDRYYKTEKLGVPKIFPGALVVSEETFLAIFPNDRARNEVGEPCSLIGGRSFGRENFQGEDNPLSALGFNIVADLGDRQLENYARHEAVHQADFLREERQGIDQLLTEVIAHQIDSLVGSSKADRKKQADQLSNFLDDGLEAYVKSLKIKPAAARAVVNRAIADIDYLTGLRGESHVPMKTIISTLLDCTSFNDLFELANDIREIEKTK